MKSIQRLLYLLSGIFVITCGLNNAKKEKQTNDILSIYKIPIIEMTNSSLWRVLPDSFLYPNNQNIDTISITKMENGKDGYTDYYFYNQDGLIKSILLYSDGEYYQSDFQYQAGVLIKKIEYKEKDPSHIIHSYNYKYFEGGAKASPQNNDYT
jgi:hypothetical protein